MTSPQSFGEWLRHRRRELDLTQDALARQVGCARVTIRKLEADEMRPSKQLAQLLAEQLGIPPEERAAFVRLGRSGLPVDLTMATPPLHNLPILLSSFVGREREIAQIEMLLSKNRLVTLTGAGGSGKTRLAIQVTRKRVEMFEGGAWLIELASILDAPLVAQAVAKVLGVRETSDQPLHETLALNLRSKPLLLVLDNCEHLITACAELADYLLSQCPRLKVLATSREPLNITGESVFQVPTLSLPELQSVASPEMLMKFEAIHLFVDRALSVRPDFALSAPQAPFVNQICHRLDGIPLAIELATAWLKILSVEQIALRLSDQFDLLTTGSRTALPRQQTLRATIDWSYNLLSERERVFFRRLAVFVGGFALEAAEAVCADEAIHKGQILGLLSHLVNQSLVVVVENDRCGAVRYRLLETIRLYAYDKLLEAGEEDWAKDRHLEFFVTWAEQTEPKLYGPEQVVCLDRLEADHDNLRNALHWSLLSDRAEFGLRLALALFWFWFLRGYGKEALEWLQRTLSVNGRAPKTIRAKALYEIAYLTSVQRNLTLSAALAEQSLALFQEVGDKHGVGLALSVMTEVASYRDDYQKAWRLGEESVRWLRESEDKYYLAQILGDLGEIATDEGDNVRALAFYEESLILHRELGDEDGIAYHLYLLGRHAQLQGDNTRAISLLNESLTMFRAVRNPWGNAFVSRQLGYIALHQDDLVNMKTFFEESLLLFAKIADIFGIASTLNGLAAGAVAQGYLDRAVRLFAATEGLLQMAGMSLSPDLRVEYVQGLAVIRSQLDITVFSTVWAEGRAMTLEQAIEFALQP
jgi:predicted ATPase/DNA-binding XRE family transcriptional regulator